MNRSEWSANQSLSIGARASTARQFPRYAAAYRKREAQRVGRAFMARAIAWQVGAGALIYGACALAHAMGVR